MRYINLHLHYITLHQLNSSHTVSTTALTFLFFVDQLLGIQRVVSLPCHVVEPTSKADVTCTHMRYEAFVAGNGRNLIQ